MKLTFKKTLYFLYLFSCLAAILSYFYYSLSYKNFKNYTIKNQKLITPIFLNILEDDLKKETKNIIKQINPIGILLYKDNFKSYKQVKKLIKDLKNIFPNRKLYIAIDQEGGQIDRIKKITEKQTLKSANYYGQIAQKDLEKAKKLLYNDSANTAKTMKKLGVDINFAPMVDLIHKKSDNKKITDSWSATNDRSYSRDPKIVIELAKSFIQGMRKHNIMTCIKHIPGIGRTYHDTHDEKNVTINTEISTLQKTDFSVFKALANESDFAMVGHAIYSKIDNKPATLSSKTINYIRNELNFKGILFSDALNMKAVNKIKNVGNKSLESGIDIVIPNYLDYHIATQTVNNIDKNILIRFNKKLRDLNLLKRN